MNIDAVYAPDLSTRYALPIFLGRLPAGFPSPAEGAPIETCTIITTEPNDLMATIHNRMPVILAPSFYEQWLDPAFQQVATLNTWLRPFPAEHMTAFPVSTLVNNPRNDAPQCLEPVSV